MFLKRTIINNQRGSFILTIVITLAVLMGTIGLATVQLTSANFANLETSGIALKSQQLAKVKALQSDVTSYAAAETLVEPKQLINPTNLYRETTVSAEITKPDGTKEKIVSISVFRTQSDIKPVFSLDTILSSKATTQGIPTGTIVWFAALTPPSGFIICNGQSTSGYPELAKIVGNAVPDLRGEFIRGLDLGRGLDDEPFRSIRSFQNAGLPNILGNVGVFITDVRFRSNSGALNVTRNGGWLNVPAGGVASEDSISFDASKSNSIYGSSTTVRPRNIALLPCIKT